MWISGELGNTFELDELYWFVGRKGKSETRENVYLMTMISREPRQILGFQVARDKSAWRIQEIVDKSPYADQYCTDGYVGYMDIIYPGHYVRNIHNKNDTHNIESVNADLRHYIPVLRRKSRCFCRTLETLDAVVSVFVDAYNKFGEAKHKYKVPVKHKAETHSKHLHQFREVGFSVLDFL